MRALAWFALAVLVLPAEPRRLTLRQAVELAEKQSPEVRISALRSLEAEAAALNVKSAYQPQVGIAVGAAYQTGNLQGIGLVFPGFPSRLGPYRTFDARPRLTQTVLDLSLLSGIRAAGERTRESRFDEETARQSVLAAVLQLYLQVFQAESRIAAAAERLRTAEAVLEQARNFAQAGTANKLDVARSEQQMHAERVVVANARRDRATLKVLLLKTIGLDPAEDVVLDAPRLDEAQPRERRVSVAAAIEQRPEVSALEARLRAAGHDRKKAERERLPRLSFAGDYGTLGAGPDRSLSTYSVGASVTIPIWTGGRIESGIKAARARIGQVEEELRNTKLRVSQEVKQAGIETEAARESLEAAGGAAAAARTALELARLRFQAGISTNVDLATAQSALAEAEDLEIRSRYEYHLAAVRLARAEGDVTRAVARMEN